MEAKEGKMGREETVNEGSEEGKKERRGKGVCRVGREGKAEAKGESVACLSTSCQYFHTMLF